MFSLSLLPDVRWETTSQLLGLGQALLKPRPCVPRPTLKSDLSHLSSINFSTFVRWNQLKMCPSHSRLWCPESFQPGICPQLIAWVPLAVLSGEFCRSLVLCSGHQEWDQLNSFRVCAVHTEQLFFFHLDL